MTADASGVLLTEIVNHHNGVVIGTYGAVIFGIATVVLLAVVLYASSHCSMRVDDRLGAVTAYSFVFLIIAACITAASVIGVATCSYELSEAIRVYESVYGPLPGGLF